MQPILERVNSPADLKKLEVPELEQLADEIRELLIEIVSVNGGHLASSLGAIELTIALHRVFTSPVDKIVWDVGHQAYAHKLLTGRRQRFTTLRQYGGISGFPVPSESPHDAFNAGHAGNSISAALGMALARDLSKQDYHVVAMIGDGSLSAGMALEAVNHIGNLDTNFILILNDNGMSISPSIGAIAELMNQVRFDHRYEFAKEEAKKAIVRLPLGKLFWSTSKWIKNLFERAILINAFWEELGFTYLGPINGHNIKELETAFCRARDFNKGPVMVHVITRKGKGHPEAETNATKFHGISPNNVKKSSIPTYSNVFGNTLLRLMEENEKLVAITAAMLDGTGLAEVAKRFPERVFDVGICEQHAVTLAAGLATQGFVPVVAIYSTFLQRAYDQIIHDVCIPNLPVVFAIDRAGIVGDDGKTHQGPFDLSYLRSVPNMTVAAPRNENELQNLLYTAVKSGQPMAVRYPRGNGYGISLESDFREITIGSGEILREGNDVTVLAVGSTVIPALTAAEQLAVEGIQCTVADIRFVKPVDAGLILELAGRTNRLITVEENTLAGGFGSAVMELLASSGINGIKIENIALPDRFIEHGSQELLRSMCGVDAEGIARRIKDTCMDSVFDTADKLNGKLVS